MKATKLVTMLLALTVLSVGPLAHHAYAAEGDAPQASTQSDDAVNDLAFYALSLAGTPYKYGGISPETGFDCSGFVHYVFREALGIELPHNAKGMNAIGEHIDANQLRPGDLVFYNTMRRAFSHVGIYLGDQQFVHSPSRGGGIRVENMADSYWKKRFNGARRISSLN